MGSIPRILPILRELGPFSEHRPLQASDFSRVSGAKNANLEKSRAARAKTTTMTNQLRDLAAGNSKTEDPAKMTDSIPDFVSRNAANNQECFQYLERKSPIIKIKS